MTASLCNLQGRVSAYRCVLEAGHTGNHVMMVPPDHVSAPESAVVPTKRRARTEAASENEPVTDPLMASGGMRCDGRQCGLGCDGKRCSPNG